MTTTYCLHREKPSSQSVSVWMKFHDSWMENQFTSWTSKRKSFSQKSQFVSTTKGRHTSLQDGFEPDPLESFVIENTCSITTELMAAGLNTGVMRYGSGVLSVNNLYSRYIPTSVIRPASITCYLYYVLSLTHTQVNTDTSDISMHFFQQIPQDQSSILCLQCS